MDNEVTLRSAVEWYKDQVRTAPTDDGLDLVWADMVRRLATEHQVPVGWLSWALSELARSELALLATVSAEADMALLPEGGTENFGGSA